jgi:anti-sigma-K factor RskA
MNDIHSYVGAFVTHALDDELRIAFAAHLPDCDSCTQEVHEFNETLTLLASLTDAQPPERLRADVLESVSRVRVVPPNDASRPVRDRSAQSGPDHAGRGYRWSQIAVAASLILAVLFGSFAVIQQLRIDEIERAQSLSQPAAELLKATDLQTYPFTWPDGAKGAYLVSRQQNRALITGAVPTVEPGRTYQLWSMRNGHPDPGPTFDAAANKVWTADFDKVQAIAITTEPEGGSPQPTNDPIVVTPI